MLMKVMTGSVRFTFKSASMAAEALAVPAEGAKRITDRRRPIQTADFERSIFLTAGETLLQDTEGDLDDARHIIAVEPGDELIFEGLLAAAGRLETSEKMVAADHTETFRHHDLGMPLHDLKQLGNPRVMNAITIADEGR